MGNHFAEKSSSFLCLPTEIRLEIYGYVLTSQWPLTVQCWKHYTTSTFATRIVQYPKCFLSLLRTCRQIHAETRLLPLQLNTFRFKSQDAFLPWLEKLGAGRASALRNVELVTWMARHMVEGGSWVAMRLEECFPLRQLEDLRIVKVEVRMTGRTRDCARGECWNCEGHGVGVGEEEKKLGDWFRTMKPGVEVTYTRVAA